MPVDLRISLKKLEVLTRVVELGGVTRAAEDLYVAQPVVTAHIRSLERRLGTPLFYREGRHLQLTPAGRAVHQWAEEVLLRTRECDRVLGELSNGSGGAACIGASLSVGSYLLPAAFAEFQSDNPHTRLQLAIKRSSEVMSEVRAGGLDFGVVVLDGAEVANLSTEKLGQDELVLVAAGICPGHDSPNAEADPPASLQFVDSAEGFLEVTSIGDRLLGYGVTTTVALRTGHPEAAKLAVRQGTGVALLSRSAVRAELAGGDLRELRIVDLPVLLPICLVYRVDWEPSALHERLIDRIRLAVDAARLDSAAPLALLAG